MGTYFRRNYSPGERVEIPSDWIDGTFDDWNKWKQHRLITLGFYDQKHMRKPPYNLTHEAPPRIHLRGDGAEISNSSLSSGHMEFKVWLQNKIEEVALGKASPRFLSEQGRESEREKAMEVWEDLSRNWMRRFYNRFFDHKDKLLDEKGKSNRFRESRHLIMLIEAWELENQRENLLSPNRITMETSLGDTPYDQHNPIGRICREAVRVLIGKSFTSEVDSLSFTSIPGMTFIEELQKRIFGIIKEEIEIISNNIDALTIEIERGNESKNLFDKKEALKQLMNDGFGSLNGPSKNNTEHNSIKLAYDFINLLLEEELLQKSYMTENEYNQYFHDGDETKERKYTKHLPNKLVFTEKLWEWIDESENKENHPIFRWLRGEQDRWMYCPPIPHQFDSKTPIGGLLIKSNRKIVGGRETIFTAFEPPNPRCEPSKQLYSTLNDLQDTQWEINLDFLSCIFDIELNDDNRTILPHGGWKDKTYRIKKIKVKSEFETVFTPLDSKGKIDSKSFDDRTLVLEWARRIIEHNANVFWHSWICDFRGRMSPRCTKLSPQGNDLDRALIRFKHWKPLGEEGIYWLRIHIHNMMEEIEANPLKSPAAKQSTFDQRSNWVEDNIEGLRTLAKNPAAYLSELKLNRYVGRSEALQRVAALVELDRVYAEYEDEAEGGDWSKITSGLPVHLDASCNGYQHVAALLRDYDLGHQVNLVGDESERPRDLYGVVAKNADRVEASNLVRKILNEDQITEAMDSAFSRGSAKLPTMTRVYGSDDIPKCLHGRNGRGKPEYSKPIYPLSPKDELVLEKIPEMAKQVFNDWRIKSTKKGNKEEDDFPWNEFKRHCKNKNGKQVATSTWKRWKRILGKTKSIPLWAVGSGLHTALMLNVSDSGGIPNAFIENEEIQYKLTYKVADSLDKSIEISTGKAFYKLEEPLRFLSTSSNGKWPAISWVLPDEFVVNNYYVKHHGKDSTSAGMPCHPDAAYSQIVPDWYSNNEWNGHKNNKSKKRIAVRLEYLYGKDKRVAPELRNSLKKMNEPGNKVSLTIIENILSEVDPDNQSKDAKEIRKMLTHGSYSLLRYHKDEAKRVDKKRMGRGLSPNFVHSLDAYHMRTSVRKLSEECEDQLSFWAVHDAFGTHACDVPMMRVVVKEKFVEMYEGTNLSHWLDNMVENSPGVEIDFDKDPIKVNRGRYKNMKVNDHSDHGPGLKTLFAERGLDYPENSDAAVRCLMEHDAIQAGVSVEELYPDIMLKDIWDKSNTSLDISECADSGYLIS